MHNDNKGMHKNYKDMQNKQKETNTDYIVAQNYYKETFESWRGGNLFTCLYPGVCWLINCPWLLIEYLKLFHRINNVTIHNVQFIICLDLAYKCES